MKKLPVGNIIFQSKLSIFVCFMFISIFGIIVFSSPLRAADTFTLWAAGSNVNAESNETDLPEDAVSWWLNPDDNRYYLFLPATAELEQLKIWFTGAEDSTVGGTALKSGAFTAAFANAGDYVIAADGREYPLTVVQSANVNAAFVTTESGTMKNIDSSEDHSVGEAGSLLLLGSDGTVEYENELEQIKGRGNSTWLYSKKPYQIKLDKKTDLFDMGKHKTWILLANHLDRSLLRNTAVFDLAQRLQLPFTSKDVYVDLYANHQYLGNYLLTEKVQIGDNRVEITDLEKATEDCNENDLASYGRGGDVDSNAAGTSKWYDVPNDPEDITGGYLLEFERSGRYRYESSSGFVTDHGQTVLVNSPECAGKAQVAYIRSYVQDLEDAIYSDSGYNDKGKHYSEYMDVDSAALRYLIEEWTLNYDGAISSFFLYKDSDTAAGHLLHFGPVWDYDVSLGNYYGLGFNAINKWLINQQTSSVVMAEVSWYKELFDDPAFVGRVNELYQSDFKPAAEAVIADMSQQATVLEAAAAMNFTRWSNVFNPQFHYDTGGNFSENIDYLLAFMGQRTDFFDTAGFLVNEKTPPEWKNPFLDVAKENWYYDAVAYVHQQGWMRGTAPTAFAPDTALSRAMVVTVMARISGEEILVADSQPFTDVPLGTWYSDAVAWAKEKNIVDGVGNGAFAPDVPVTREAFAKILYAYAQWAGGDTNVSNQDCLAPYSDAGAISGWVRPAMLWAVDTGAIKGMTPATLVPKGESTRAQAATLLQRLQSILDA